MGKHSLGDDEIPLTHTGSNITHETRARFDSLLRAALDKEGGQLEVEKDSKVSRKPLKKDRDKQRSKKLSKNIDESPVRLHKTNVQNTDIDIVSSSDDDVVINERLNGNFQKNKENLRKDNNIDDEGVDKKSKEEKNANQRSHKNEKNSSLCEDEGIKNNVRSKIVLPSPAVRTGKHTSTPLKKPVPLPRSRLQNQSSDEIRTTEKEVNDESQRNISITSSLSPLLPLSQFLDTSVVGQSDDDDDDVCVLPKVERKGKKKKSSISKTEIQEETELKDIKSTESVEVDKEIETVLSQKSPFHRSRRKSKEVEIETISKTEKTHSEDFHYEKIVGIFIHRSECLQIDPLVQHPLVKVHLLDASTGNYLKKSSIERPVSFYYENSNVDCILPLMTEIFDYKERRSVVPVWEELLVFNEDFTYILQEDPPVLILFEILDFVNFTVASSQYRRLGSEGGWHHIAWAFLKPLGANGILNTEKQVRLQLYMPQRVQKQNCNGCDVYQWWSGGIWERYPSTLYVTVKGITPPEHLPPVLRSRSALQGELSQTPPFLDLDASNGAADTKSDIENSMASAQLLPSTNSFLPSWSRLPSQSCKIPNQRRFILPTASRGCFCVKFSNSGLHLACSVASEEKYTILVYSISTGEECVQLVGHQGLIYDLDWSSKDTMLLSASADCTVCLWDTEARKSGPLQMLPHPSFVYCAHFHPSNSSVLVTGCCDHVVRVWNRPRKTSQFELAQELEGHTGFISAVALNSDGILYSADSVGKILEWMGVKGKQKKQSSYWKLNRHIDIRELRETVINRIKIHPGGQRLLIHARDSRLRMLDITTASVIQWFNGALNHRVQTSACLSPCGGLVLAASEDSTVRVWNADTGEQLAIYSGLQFHRGTSGLDYHPYEHMAAFASYGSNTHVVVCDYSKSASGKEIGLQVLFQQEVSAMGTLQSAAGDMSDSLLRNSHSLGMSHISDPFSSKKKKKKSLPVNYINERDRTSQQALSVFSDSLKPTSEASMSSLSPNSTNVASPWKENDSESSKARLASIIEKMDQVLSRTPSRSSQQISESLSRVPDHTDYKLTDSQWKPGDHDKSSQRKNHKQKVNQSPL